MKFHNYATREKREKQKNAFEWKGEKLKNCGVQKPLVTSDAINLYLIYFIIWNSTSRKVEFNWFYFHFVFFSWHAILDGIVPEA